MKKFSSLFIAFLLWQFTTPAQLGWFEQTSGTMVDLNPVFFVNNDIGWVVGIGGVIIQTTDSD